MRANLLWSMGFGILMGLVFPFYADLFAEFPDEGLRRLFCAGCITAGIVVGIVSFLISRGTIIRIVRRVARQMQSIAEGTADLSQRLCVESDDAVGALVRWFNVIMDRISDVGRDVGASCRQTTGIGSELSSVSEQAGASLAGVIDGIAVLKTAVGRLENHVAPCLDGIHEIRKTTEEFHRHVAEQSAVVDDGSSIVRDMLDRFARLSEGIAHQKHRATDLLDMVADTERSLSTASTVIGDAATGVRGLVAKIAAIADVAARINLLSMNASIQAARAGEAGKSFNVIAADIRRLAATTNSHAEDISGALDTIIDQIGTASTAERETRNVFQREAAGIKEVSAFLTETAQEGERLSKDSRGVLDAMGRLGSTYVTSLDDSQSIRDQTVAIEAAIDGIRSSADCSYASLDEIHRAAEDISTVVDKLSDSGSRLRSSADELSANVSRFDGAAENAR